MPTDKKTAESINKSESVKQESEHDKDAKQLLEAKNKRDVGDIPITDDYWKLLREFQAKHGQTNG